MCYTVPLAAGITTTLIWRKNKSQKTWWLNLMLYGGSLFGIIDHLWNGELFLVGDNIVGDLLLGVVITASIFIAWTVAVRYGRVNLTLAKCADING